jgi:putative FmdB family regulatory protein
MPIYEYRCLTCKRRTSVFVRSISSPVDARCEHCGGSRLTRLMSKFAVHRPGLDLDSPSALDGIDENDPQAVARWARQMKDEMGEDLGPEFDDMVDRIEAGEDPESVMAEGGMGGEDFGGDDDF